MVSNFKKYATQGWNYNGLSAKCIYGFVMNNRQEFNYPHDPDDLCRCIQVLRMLFRDNEEKKIDILRSIGATYNSKEYLALANNWNELMDILKSEWESTKEESLNPPPVFFSGVFPTL